jgi:hypothetical protein
VFENRVLRKILGSGREKVNRIQGAIYCMIKSSKMRLEGHVTCVRKKKCVQSFHGEM